LPEGESYTKPATAKSATTKPAITKPVKKVSGGPAAKKGGTR
jgi:hypothetical protein